MLVGAKSRQEHAFILFLRNILKHYKKYPISMVQKIIGLK